MDINKAEMMAEDCIRYYVPEWTFVWSTAKRRRGSCHFGPKEIQLSIEYAKDNDEYYILDTILHEIAHAIAGARVHHGPQWQAVCLDIGAEPRRVKNDKEIKRPQHLYESYCPSCNAVHKRYYRKPNRNRGLRSCGWCDTRFNPNYILKIRRAT